jgi:hypothetical protein
MPQRRLPKSNTARLTALRTSSAKNAVTPAPDRPLTAGTQAALAVMLPLYNGLMNAAHVARVAQVAATEVVEPLLRSARLWVSHGFQALINACVREQFSRSVLGYYGLDSNANGGPELVSLQQVLDGGAAFAQGEADRTGAGGDPITFPLPSDIADKVDQLNTAHLNQSARKTAYDNSLEAIDAQNPEADRLILKLWNEIETAFDTGDKPSMRRKAREWGVVYVPGPGEAPSPEDYSAMGKVTAAPTGAPLPDVSLTMLGPDVTVTTDSEGRYYFGLVADGTYPVKATLPGYVQQDLSLTVVAGTITELNISMVPE